MLERPISKAGWTRVRFDQIATQINDRVDNPAEAGVERYVGLEHLDPDSLHIRRWGEPTDVESTKLRFQPGDIIFGKRRVYQRKVAVADFEGICSAHAMVLRAKSDAVLPEFLPFFMQSDMFMERALSISVGSLSPTINWKTLAAEEFLLPPLPAQARLVEIFLSTVRYSESLFKLARKAEALFIALAENLLNSPSIPKLKLSEVVDYASDGPFGSKLKTEHYSASGVRVIRLNNIAPNIFLNDDKAYIPLSYFHTDLERYEVRPGDIVIAGLGDDEIPPGRSCVVPTDLGPSINKADCFCLRVNSRMDARYLSFFLNSPMGLSQSKEFSQGTTRIRLNLENIKRFNVPVPNGYEQVEIVEKLDDAYSAWTGVLERVAKASELQKFMVNSQLSMQQ
ncbi:restriction endonuclease subunit S [Sinorhizobium glycinis]|uniref:restriction endonuclease subunit S n=1 Tax=Sinorhizobium glycinis TaxID=1472378 RepID=UPI0007DA204C|nr:restriction endonuclease subunit S [Sinorhizobium glycinis]